MLKKRIRKTGEIVEIISYQGTTDRCELTDYVSYIDSKGEEHPREKMNLYWDFADVENSPEPSGDLRSRIQEIRDELALARRGAELSILNSESAKMQEYNTIRLMNCSAFIAMLDKVLK